MPHLGLSATNTLILLFVIVFPMRVRELLLKQHVHKIEVTYDILSDVCGRLKA